MRLARDRRVPTRTGWGLAAVAALVGVALLADVFGAFGSESVSDRLNRSSAGDYRDGVHDLRRLLHRDSSLIEAELLLTAQCLEQSGIMTYPPLEDHRLNGRDKQLSFSGLPPALDLEDASVHGYGPELGLPDDAADPVPDADSHLMAMSPDQEQMYFALLSPPHAESVDVRLPGTDYVVGAPTSGCVAEARTTLYGSVRDWLIVNNLPVAGVRQFAVDALSEQPVVLAAESYAQCMFSSGYRYENPGAARQGARNLFGRDGPTRELSSDERTMSAADAQCQLDSGVYTAAENATIALARPWIEENFQEIRRIAKVREDAISQARKLVGVR